MVNSKEQTKTKQTTKHKQYFLKNKAKSATTIKQ